MYKHADEALTDEAWQWLRHVRCFQHPGLRVPHSPGSCGFQYNYAYTPQQEVFPGWLTAQGAVVINTQQEVYPGASSLDVGFSL